MSFLSSLFGGYARHLRRKERNYRLVTKGKETKLGVGPSLVLPTERESQKKKETGRKRNEISKLHGAETRPALGHQTTSKRLSSLDVGPPTHR